MRPQDFPNQEAKPLRYCFLRFHGQICKEAYAPLEPGENCAVRQVCAVLGLERKAVKDIVSESVEARYGARKEDTNPYWDDYAQEIPSWRQAGVTEETLLDIAKKG